MYFFVCVFMLPLDTIAPQTTQVINSDISCVIITQLNFSEISLCGALKKAAVL